MIYFLGCNTLINYLQELSKRYLISKVWNLAGSWDWIKVDLLASRMADEMVAKSERVRVEKMVVLSVCLQGDEMVAMLVALMAVSWEGVMDGHSAAS